METIGEVINVELLHITTNKVYSFDSEITQEEINTFQASDGSGYTYVKDYVVPIYTHIKTLAELTAEFKSEMKKKEMTLEAYTSLAGKLLGLEFAVSNGRVDAVIGLLTALPIDDVYITKEFKDSYLTQLNLLL